MFKVLCILCFTLLAVAKCHPSVVEYDNGLVSLNRKARTTVPEHIEDILGPDTVNAFLHTYGDDKADDDDTHGYTKKSNDKHAGGYKHFDSFHKKDGNKYGFEKQSEYGQDSKANIELENNEAHKEHDAYSDYGDKEDNKKESEHLENDEEEEE